MSISKLLHQVVHIGGSRYRNAFHADISFAQFHGLSIDNKTGSFSHEGNILGRLYQDLPLNIPSTMAVVLRLKSKAWLVLEKWKNANF